MKTIFGLFILLTLLACKNGNEGENSADTVPPTVTATTPADNATKVPLNTKITVTYSEPIQLGISANISVNNKNVTTNVSGNQLFLETELQDKTDYEVNISGRSVLDKAKNYASEVTFTFSTKAAPYNEINPQLATPTPSPEAVNVYNFLLDNYGKKTISSAMANVSWNLNEADWVKLQTGKYPAMATVDYIHLHYSPASWIDYSTTSFMEDWWSNNGLVSACWHWNVPKSDGSTEYAFYTSETTFKASNATIDGTWENNVVKADLEKITAYLKLLRDKNIPVIWRPLHEAAGNIYEYQGGTAWFWWGNNGAEAYKKLWIYMFNYFQQQGLNNLIWVWTTQTKDNAFYPGDDYVDIIGRDIYNNTQAGTIAEEFAAIQEAYPTKMIALSEMGNVANISAQWEAGAAWSYFMPWYDYERTNNKAEADFNQSEHQHANAAWWKDALESDAVITRDEMPSLK